MFQPGYFRVQTVDSYDTPDSPASNLTHMEIQRKGARGRIGANVETCCGIRGPDGCEEIVPSRRVLQPKIVYGHPGDSPHQTRAQLMRCLSQTIGRVRMIPLALPLKRDFEVRRLPFRRKRSGSREPGPPGIGPFWGRVPAKPVLSFFQYCLRKPLEGN
jgi:hypothetical protein